MSSGTPARFSLRSSSWLAGDDEVALQNRAAFRSVGLNPSGGRPVVGISNTISDLNSCNSGMADQIGAARASVLEAGGIPVVFPTMSLGEDLMKPTAMLYRNLLSIEVEEMVRAHPLDALILTANCDKTIPGAIMGAISANVPTVLMLGGPRPTTIPTGERVASGTDLWKKLDEFRAGRLSAQGWRSFEQSYSCGVGACNVMGTATTMAIVAEVLGFTLPGAATIPAGDHRAVDAAGAAGELAVKRALDPLCPQELVSDAAIDNAVKIVAAIGGSTNALIHLAAIAGRTGRPLSMERVAGLLRGIPTVVDLLPIGTGVAQDLDRSGGVPAILAAISGLLNLSTRTIGGCTLREIAAEATGVHTRPSVIRSLDDPVIQAPTMTILTGTLFPDGAVIKSAAASPSLQRHCGRAVVFDGYDDMRGRLDDPALEVDARSVLLLRHCGPVGGPGMPEWGMIPIPRKLATRGVSDMVRISDARMSGTSFGTVVLHGAPEAAIGGPLALVRDGDLISLDVESATIDLLVDEAELARRRDRWQPPARTHTRGWPALYQDRVTQAPLGCDFDFLEASTPTQAIPVNPTVGRS